MNKCRRLLLWWFTVTLSLPFGSLLAAPQDCLARGGNAEVAACANQYGSGTPAPRSRPNTPPTGESRARPLQTGGDAELVTVPVARGPKASPAPESPAETFAVDREALTYTVIAGAVGGSLLVLVAFGIWRWSSTLKRTCPWCTSRISRSARTCPRCFRAL